MSKRIKKLINRWWTVRGQCDNDEQMLTMILSEIQHDPEMFGKLVEGLEHRVVRK